FFGRVYSAGNRMRFWAGHLKPVGSDIKTVLSQMMSAPLFPIPIDVLNAKLEFRDFSAGETLNPYNGVRLITATLNHPDGATGYRVEYRRQALAYINAA